MFSLIPQIILLFCFGLIIWLVIKNLPKVNDDEGGKSRVIEVEPSFEKKRKLSHKIPIEKIDAKVNSFLEKVIRRFRIILMKVDTYLQKHLDALKNHSKPKSIFKGDDNLIVKEEIESVGTQEARDQVLEDFKKEIDLIAGIDKSIDELLPNQERIEFADDEVEVLVIGQEDIVKKFDLEPEAEIIEEKKNKV